MRSLFKRKPDSPAREAIDQAEAMAGEGRIFEAIEMLTAANRAAPDPAAEHALVTLRNRAFAELEPHPSQPAEPVPVPVRGDDGDDGLPALDASELTAGAVRGAILEKGSVIVRNLVAPERAAELVAGIDRAFAGREGDGANGSAEGTPWLRPFEPAPEYERAVGMGRAFVNDGSGIWLADSPRALFQLADTFESAGLRELITEYLGERPAISVNKGTLRRAAPTVGTEWWHQDGAFLGGEIRSLNVWLSLTDCGVDAPGMDIVGRRLESIVETGTRDADFEWSVSPEVVAEIAGDDISRPVFRPGDALLFDHLCLHKTASSAEMTKTRYATETWFFAPSAYPDPAKQVPLVF